MIGPSMLASCAWLASVRVLRLPAVQSTAAEKRVDSTPSTTISAINSSTLNHFCKD